MFYHFPKNILVEVYKLELEIFGLKFLLHLFLVLRQLQHLFGYISAVGQTNQLLGLPISPQVTGHQSHNVSESVMRYKWPLVSMSVINCQGEITPREKIKPETSGLEIRCFLY